MFITRTNSIDDFRILSNMWYKEWPDTFKDTTIQETVHRLQTLVNANAMFVLIIREGSIIVCSCCVCCQSCEILNLVTHSHYRKKGYATKILRYVIQEAPSVGIEVLRIGCSRKYIPWLERTGFQYNGLVNDHSGEHCMEVNCKPLSPIFKNL
jgi:GNAT superfamily N-acetyltransferase